MGKFDIKNENHLGMLGEVMEVTKPHYWYAIAIAAAGAAAGWAFTGGEPGGPLVGGVGSGLLGLLAIHFMKRANTIAAIDVILEANPDMIDELKENPA
ncbi:MAG: hypothetical protein AAB955_02700 [Patescibacteria group bacterium]